MLVKIIFNTPAKDQNWIVKSSTGSNTVTHLFSYLWHKSVNFLSNNFWSQLLNDDNYKYYTAGQMNWKKKQFSSQISQPMVMYCYKKNENTDEEYKQSGKIYG
jgi:hypothetical protein